MAGDVTSSDRNVTLRRILEQVVHCAEEALSVVTNSEDPRCAVDDLLQARDLITEAALPTLTRMPSPGPPYEDGIYLVKKDT